MPKLRPFTWVILVINVIFLVWVITGIASASPDCPPGQDAELCQAASQIGTGIGVAVIVGLWVAADFILGVLWLITRPRRRDCPVCGESVKKGVMVCPRCNTSFAAVYANGPGQQQGGQQQ